MPKEAKALRVGRESDRGPKMEIMVNGEPVEAHAGETVATALLADGSWTCQTHEGQAHGGVLQYRGVP